MIKLCELAEGMPAITPAFGNYLAQAGAVCLESQGHHQGQLLSIQGKHQSSLRLTWPEVSDQMLRTLNDPEVATEHGAVGIAVLLAKKILGFSVIQRARKGTGFDYWLGNEEIIPFQNKARLEISGIRTGSKKNITKRIHQKLNQTNPSDETGLPAHIIVIEFSQPTAQMEEK